VDEPKQLPEVPQNAVILEYLRGQASPPSGPRDYTLGPWQLHTHPDLVEELQGLAPGWRLTAAYGVPLLACEGIAAVAALGTDWLAVRVDRLPPGVQTEDDLAPEWLSLVRGGWHILSPVQDQLPPGDVGPTLRKLASVALAHASSLAMTQQAGR
jgi:hypothetical protein